MKHYNATTKLQIKVNAQTEEEAQTIAKQTIDQALYAYSNHGSIETAVEHISKAKVIWVKEESPVNRKNNTSGHRGIYWHKGGEKWVVQKTVNGKRITLGRFADKDEAIRAYQDHDKRMTSDYII